MKKHLLVECALILGVLTSCNIIISPSSVASSSSQASSSEISSSSSSASSSKSSSLEASSSVEASSSEQVSSQKIASSSQESSQEISSVSSQEVSSVSSQEVVSSSNKESSSEESSSSISSISSQEYTSSSSQESSSSQAKDSINIIANGGYEEGMYAEFSLLSNSSLSNYSISYKKSTSSSYTNIDSNLIRLINDTTIRVDVLGLTSGTYSLKIDCKNSSVDAEAIINDINVSALDRSGYARFGNSGVGGYNDDGTIKDNALIVYVSEANKNSVSLTVNNKTYTGLSNILQNQSKFNKPLIVRILGQVSAATWNPLTVDAYSEATTSTVKGVNDQYLALQNYSEEDIVSGGFNTLDESKYTKLNGLTNKIKYDSSKKEFDSYYNMLDVNNASEVTIEGVGTNAQIFQWGFTFKASKSIEVRNLTFDDYTEDACSFEGSSSENTESLSGFTSKYYWVHNNTFNRGVNYWDVCSEQDKHDGDGCTDFKYCANVTIDYNHYYNTHKTGLVGGSNTQHQANFTFHHNYYDNCQSRLPFARQANMHMYNNYYYKSTGINMQLYAGAYAFIENCYFEEANNPMVTSESALGYAKLYNNTFTNCKGTNCGTEVSSRTATVTNTNCYGQAFDTDSSLFYYDATNQKSNVTYMTNASQAKADCVALAGVLTNTKASSSTSIDEGQDSQKTSYTISFNTNMEGLSQNNYSVTIGESVTLPTLSMDGYTFNGWYSDSSLTTKVNTTYTPTGDITLYASWTSNSVTPTSFIADSFASGKAFSNGDTIFTSNKFDVSITGVNATVTAGNSKAAANDNSGLEFTSAFLPSGTTGTGKGFILTAKETTTVAIYFTTTDSKFTTADQSKSGELKINDVQVSTVDGNKSNKIAYAYTLSIEEGQTYTINSSGNRLAIFAII